MEILNEILKWGDKNVSSPVCDFFGARLDSSVWIECGFVGRVGLGRNLDCVIEKKFFKSQATNLRESRGDHDSKKRENMTNFMVLPLTWVTASQWYEKTRKGWQLNAEWQNRLAYNSFVSVSGADWNFGCDGRCRVSAGGQHVVIKAGWVEDGIEWVVMTCDMAIER